MPTTKFKKNLDEFKRAVKVDRGSTSKIYKFEDVQGQYYKNRALSYLKTLKEEAKGFSLISEDHNTIQKLITALKDMENLYQQGLDDEKKRKMDLLMNQIERSITTIDFKQDFLDKKKREEQKERDFQVYKDLSIPHEVREELLEDIEEMNRCYESSCYKASVIMCGRILETSLLRLYYDESGNDLLATAPGIGLGKIIAKLSEKGISLGPGMNEQIHLINKARISSVHAKQEVFRPSKEQTQAIMLYTLDVLKRVFK